MNFKPHTFIRLVSTTSQIELTRSDVGDPFWVLLFEQTSTYMRSLDCCDIGSKELPIARLFDNYRILEVDDTLAGGNYTRSDLAAYARAKGYCG